MTRRTTIVALAGVATLAFATAAAAQGVAKKEAATAVSAPVSAAKKELVQRVLRLQQGDIEVVARGLVERPAAQMMQEAGMHIQRAIPEDKREATARAIEAEVKKYVEESYPIVRDRALKIAPATMGTVLESKMSEEELKQLVAWLESQTNKKFQQLNGGMRNDFVKQLLSEAGPLVQPKLVALDGRIRVVLGVPPASASGSAPTPAPASRPAAK